MSQQSDGPSPLPGNHPESIAYRKGYVEGHLAGWRDAMAAQTAAAPDAAVVQAPTAAPTLAVVLAPTAPEILHAPDTPAVAIPAMPVSTPFAPAVPLPNGSPQNYSRPVSPAPGPVLDATALAVKKNKRETQNINITLYVASLLMVAAAALFVGSALPVTARLLGVWLGTGLFYGAGMFLHGRVARLKPAAVAFTGTALAIIPFAGLATFNLGVQHAPTVWLMTSLVGTVAYIFAAIRMKSRLVVYLSMAFLLSTAWSSVAVLGAALAWYFTALIVVSALTSLAGYLLRRAASDADTAAKLYAKPLSDLGPWFAPIGLVGSLIWPLGLNAADHAIVLLAGALHFAVMAGICLPRLRRYNYLGVRFSLTLAAPFLGWLVSGDVAGTVGFFSLVLALQLIVVSYAQSRLLVFLGNAAWVRRDVYFSVPLLAVGAFTWSMAQTWFSSNGGDWVLPPVSGVAFSLLVAMILVPAFLPRGEWLPLPALAAIVMFSTNLAAVDWTVLLFLALAYAVGRFATTKSPLIRHIALNAARLLAAAIVASTLAAVLPDGPGKTGLILTVAAVIAAAQLLADTLLGALGKESVVTNYSATGWALVGLLLLVAQSSNYVLLRLQRGTSLDVLAETRLEFLLAALATGAAAIGYSYQRLPRQGGYRLAELVAPVFLASTAVVSVAVFHAAGASLSAGICALFLVGQGLRLRTQNHPAHRWFYWWAARVTSLLLGVALFQLWQEHDRTPALGTAEVTLWQVLLLGLAAQLLILACAQWRGYFPQALPSDVWVVVVLSLMVMSTEIATGPGGASWTAAVVVGFVGVSMAVLGWVTAVGRSGVHAWAPPLAMVLMAMFWSADSTMLLILLPITIATSGVLAFKAASPANRGAYFLLARIAVTALVVVILREFKMDLALASFVFTVALLVQVALQYWAQRPGQANAVGEPLYLRLALWLILAAQVLTPVTYYLGSAGFSPHGTGQRWVAAVELVVLAVTAVIGQMYLKQRGASYLAIIALVGGAAVIAPVLLPGATTLGLLALVVGVVTWRCLYTPETVEMRWYWLIATFTFLATAWLVDGHAALGFFAAIWLVAGLSVLAATHVIKQPRLTLVGAAMVLIAAFLFRAQIVDYTQRTGLADLTGFVVVVGVLYLVRLLALNLAEDSCIHRYSLVGVALGAGTVFAFMSMFDDSTVFAGAAGITVVATLLCFEVPAAARQIALDASIISCALVWFWATSTHINLGFFWFVQWCAVALGFMAMMRYLAKQQATGRALLLSAACFASFGAVLTIFSGDTLQQLLSLLIFVILLAVGMSLDERIFTIWGAIGVTTAVLWYLRGFTYILLALLALVLIVFAVWRLNRKKPAGTRHASESEPVATNVDSPAEPLP